MATVNKDFKIKSGLIVEGTTATVNGHDILTKKTADQNYVIDLIGGTATSANEVNKVVKRDANGDFAAHVITADLVGDVTGNADTATTLATSRNIQLTGDVTGTVSFNGSANAVISTTLNGSFATDAEVATAQTNAQTFATSAVAAEAALRVSGDSASVATASADATSKANAAQAAAASDATTKANAAQAAATSAAASDATTKANAALASANSYTDTGIAALVSGAPALLDTLDELAQAIADNPNYATDVANLVSTKAPTASPTFTGTVTIPSGAALGTPASVTLTNATGLPVSTGISGLATGVATFLATPTSANLASALTNETGLPGSLVFSSSPVIFSPTIYGQTTVKNFPNGGGAGIDIPGKLAFEGVTEDSYETFLGAIEPTQDNTINLPNTSGTIALTSDVTAAQTAAQAYADALDTDDVAEGSAQYFTDARAKTSAAQLLTGATLTNITISGNGSGLTITAENGVADSTTSDLAEGSNLYFTDTRARTAVDGTNRAFTSVAINSVAKQVAATLSAPTAGVQVAHAFAKADYRSAEYLVKIANGSHTEVSKVLLTLDSSDNIAITEYGIVGTNGSLATVSAGISGSNVQLQVTTANNNSTVTVMGTLLV